MSNQVIIACTIRHIVVVPKIEPKSGIEPPFNRYKGLVIAIILLRHVSFFEPLVGNDPTYPAYKAGHHPLNVLEALFTEGDSSPRSPACHTGILTN